MPYGGKAAERQIDQAGKDETVSSPGVSPTPGAPPDAGPSLNLVESLMNALMGGKQLNPQTGMPKYPSTFPWHYQQGAPQPGGLPAPVTPPPIMP